MPAKASNFVLERRCPICGSEKITPSYDVLVGPAYYCPDCLYKGQMVIEKDPCSQETTDPDTPEMYTASDSRADEVPQEIVASGIDYVLRLFGVGLGIVSLTAGLLLTLDPYRGGLPVVEGGLLLILVGSILAIASIAFRKQSSRCF